MKKILTCLMIVGIILLTPNVYAAGPGGGSNSGVVTGGSGNNSGDTKVDFPNPDIDTGIGTTACADFTWLEKNVLKRNQWQKCLEEVEEKENIKDSSHNVVNTTIGNVWQTLTTVVQVLALGTVVFSGLRYMFASADKKADIKRGLGYLAIGAMFVFAASTVARLIVNAGGDII